MNAALLFPAPPPNSWVVDGAGVGLVNVLGQSPFGHLGAKMTKR